MDGELQPICAHQRREARWRLEPDGGLSVWSQCCRCGDTGEHLSEADPMDANLPPFDEALQPEFAEWFRASRNRWLLNRWRLPEIDSEHEKWLGSH